MKFPEPESSTLEFKRELPKNDQIIKTIVGFCNQHGGRLIIGVDDDGSIVGIPEEKIESILEYLDSSIFQASHPSIIPLVYAQRLDEKSILIIEVSGGMNKPYYIKSEGVEKGTYIRLGRSTLRATPEIIDELRWQTRGRSFDEMPTYQALLTDLDMKQFDTFLLTRKAGAPEKINTKTIDEALRAYRITTEEHSHVYPTVAGILLFGKEPQRFFSEAFIICSHFTGVSGREALASRDCDGTLIDQFKKALEFVLSSLNKSFSIKGVRRVEKLEIPEAAVREMLLNAIVHRNYHIPGPIKIAIYRNRIEIFSPGNFPQPITMGNLTAGFTHIRNLTIVKIFRELGFIEKLGTGFRILFESYEKAGLLKPQVIEGENYIKCILPRPAPRDTHYRKLLFDEQKIIDLFSYTGELSVSDVMKQLKISRSTAARALKKLLKARALQKIGRAKATRYSKV